MVMKLRKTNCLSRQNVYLNILVGFSFMVLTFLAVKTFAPDIRSNAETNTAEQTVGPYTASISLDSATAINIVPTASQAVYTGTNEITYTNTCPYGFNVTMSSVDEDTNLTRVGSDSGTKTIPTITSGTELTDNTWGFSTDGGTTYNAIPALANQVTIINTSSATATAATLNVLYGVKTDNNLPSGSYINDLIYTVSVKPQCLSYGITWDYDGGTAASGADYPTSLNFGSTLDLSTLMPTRSGYIFTGWSNGTDTFDGTETAADINPSSSPSLTMTAQWVEIVGIHAITNMQDMTPEICNATTTPAKTATTFDWSGVHHGDTSYVPRTKLTDTRDGKTYLVSKLADGNCWMSQSLALDLTANTAIIASNNDGTTKSVTPNNTTQTTTGTSWAQADNNWRSYKPQAAESYYQGGTTKSSTPSGSGDAYDWEKAGNYYNWYAATAGTGTSALANAEAGSSICPKGWRLPSNTGTKSYNYLIDVYDVPDSEAGVQAIHADPLNFNSSGHYRYSVGDMYSQGSAGLYWSSSAYSNAIQVYRLLFNASNIYLRDYNYKGHGFSVRCVAIGDTMQNYDVSKLANTGDSIVLEDERDGNQYTVKRLADGKVWMTENLRLINKAITSSDSNLPAGTSFTIPASSLSGFNANNKNNAYLDSTYGGYYTFYTATAGWGTSSITSGSSSKDICPKGWRLPTGGSSSEFNNLYSYYSSATLLQGEPGYTTAGYASNGQLNVKGDYYGAHYWSSSVQSTDNAYGLFFLEEGGLASKNYGSKMYGRPIHCVAQ